MKEKNQILLNQRDMILELALFISLTKVQVGEHKEALYELDTRLSILNKTYVHYASGLVFKVYCFNID